jgi:hypothetical protein
MKGLKQENTLPYDRVPLPGKRVIWCSVLQSVVFLFLPPLRRRAYKSNEYAKKSKALKIIHLHN